ncbi:MAG: hypothetical protein M3418_02685, partial [Gemmatimonadota bacterium]|nr:hypothetical protein [Gemmatimonadota bacterium]
CETTFRWRNAQRWPAAVAAPAEWREPYRTMAEQTGVLTTELDAAVDEIRAFVEAIQRAAD